MHLVYPQNFAFCFQFLPDIYSQSQAKYWILFEKNVYTNFGGQTIKVRYGLCENSESVDFHNDIIMHLLDFEVAQNLDDTAPKKYLIGKFGTCIN